MPQLQTTNPHLLKIANTLKPFCEHHNIIKAIVFGSWARGTQTRKSDFDLVIILDTEKRFLDRYADLMDIHNCIPDTAVEMLIYTPEEFAGISHRPFIKQIIAEGITVYER